VGFLTKQRTIFSTAVLTIISVLFTSCSALFPLVKSPTATATSIPTQTLTPDTPTHAPSVTPLSPLVILLAPPKADQGLAKTLQSAIDQLSSKDGLRWQLRQSLTNTDLPAETALVVALPPEQDLATLIQAAPKVQFLAIGISGLPAMPNLSTIGAEGSHPDQQGFIAGVVAAIITPEWRVGAISVNDTIPGKAARQGFLNGVVFFCGLCRQTYPPFYKYPLYVDLPSNSSPADWQTAANYIIDHEVSTVYIAPSAGDSAMLKLLEDRKINIIGSSQPDANLQKYWVASLGSDPIPVFEKIWPDLILEKGGQVLGTPLNFNFVNETIFSPGRQMLAYNILNELLNGYIDTGIDPTTGENR
jgi:hypothetical protein